MHKPLLGCHKKKTKKNIENTSEWNQTKKKIISESLRKRKNVKVKKKKENKNRKPSELHTK